MFVGMWEERKESLVLPGGVTELHRGGGMRAENRKACRAFPGTESRRAVRVSMCGVWKGITREGARFMAATQHV